MRNILDFLAELRLNNNRDWFQANRPRYEQALQTFNELVQQLIDEIALFDPAVQGVTPKNSNFRIYRDMRFSKNKLPYKTHMSTFISRGGRKSGYAGYYFHIEPSVGTSNRNVLSTGIYSPEPKLLRSVREEILDNGDAIVAAIDNAVGFELDKNDTLLRMPMGFEPGGKHDELIKLKNFFLFKTVDDSFILSPDLVKRVAKEFSTTKEFVGIINRAVQYAFEEM